jgi:hypothetical protein
MALAKKSLQQKQEQQEATPRANPLPAMLPQSSRISAYMPASRP